MTFEAFRNTAGGAADHATFFSVLPSQKDEYTIVCATDSPEDNLPYHGLFAEGHESFQMISAFHADLALNSASSDFANWVGVLVDALCEHVDYFHEHSFGLVGHDIGVLEFTPATS